MTMKTLYAVVLEGPGTELSGSLRYKMAEEAIQDDHWRGLYDNLVDIGGEHPETSMAILRMTQNLVPPEPGCTFLGGWWGDPMSAATPLRSRASELGERPDATVSPLDLCAAVVGSEMWCAALGTSNLMRASSFGVDAVSALSAILARASGSPAEINVRPADTTGEKPWANVVSSVILHAHLRATRLVGPRMAAEAVTLAAQDLAWGATAVSATALASALAMEAASELMAATV